MSDITLNNNSLVTVLMPVFNAGRYIEEAINSILGQTYSDFEFLIIDDGSTDRSMELISSFEDPRIKVLKNDKNKGLIETLNKGLELINTKYVVRTDADDVSLPERLKEQVLFMENNPEVGACGTWFDSILSDGKTVSGGRFLTDFEQIRLRHLYQIQIIHGTSILRTSVLDKNGLRFDKSFAHAEDYDFFDRLGNVSKIANVPRVLYKIRHHDGRVSNVHAQTQKDNSNRVKYRIFNKIGLDIRASELSMIEELMHQNYAHFTADMTERLAGLLKNIIISDNETSYFKNDFLRKELSVRFMHLCNFLILQRKDALSLLKKFGHSRITDAPKLYVSIQIRSIINRLK